VVYFYPKDDTPGCTVEAQEIRDLWSELQNTSAVVIGVSADDADSHKKFAEKHALPFLLVPDTDHRFTEAFGVPLKNGRASRVSFVIDKNGKVAKVFPEVNPRGHGRELLEAIRALG
jgi:peroxiredoxin Q/BCP